MAESIFQAWAGSLLGGFRSAHYFALDPADRLAAHKLVLSMPGAVSGAASDECVAQSLVRMAEEYRKYAQQAALRAPSSRPLRPSAPASSWLKLCAEAAGVARSRRLSLGYLGALLLEAGKTVHGVTHPSCGVAASSPSLDPFLGEAWADLNERFAAFLKDDVPPAAALELVRALGSVPPQVFPGLRCELLALASFVDLIEVLPLLSRWVTDRSIARALFANPLFTKAVYGDAAHHQLVEVAKNPAGSRSIITTPMYEEAFGRHMSAGADNMSLARKIVIAAGEQKISLSALIAVCQIPEVLSDAEIYPIALRKAGPWMARAMFSSLAGRAWAAGLATLVAHSGAQKEEAVDKMLVYIARCGADNVRGLAAGDLLPLVSHPSADVREHGFRLMSLLSVPEKKAPVVQEDLEIPPMDPSLVTPVNAPMTAPRRGLSAQSQIVWEEGRAITPQEKTPAP